MRCNALKMTFLICIIFPLLSFVGWVELETYY